MVGDRWLGGGRERGGRGGRERGREGEREGGREGEREGGRKRREVGGRREGERERGRERRGREVSEAGMKHVDQRTPHSKGERVYYSKSSGTSPRVREKGEREESRGRAG